MRNLKKFLALVMAMVMALSLMVSANAAVTTNKSYPDSGTAEKAFEEAITVLSGMGVFSGDNGSFYPTRNVTRAEAAALIYRLATGDVTDSQADLYAKYGNFSDVKTDAWYAGYVGYCANAGYIKGRPGNVFDPSGSVTGYEILAMILRVVGYDKNGEFTGPDWQVNVSALSQSLGVVANVNSTQYGGTLYLAAQRQVVADLLFQTDAYIPQVNYTTAFGYQYYGNTGGVTGPVKNQTLGEKVFGLTSNTGVIVGNEVTGEDKSITKIGFSLDLNGNIDDTMQIRHRTVTKDIGANPTNIEDYFGSAYVYASDTMRHVRYNTANGAYTDDENQPLNVTRAFKWDSDLRMMNHAVKVWYDSRSSQLEICGYSGNVAQQLRFTTNLNTYAVFDKATNVAVVALTDDDGTETSNTASLVPNTPGTNDDLYAAATNSTVDDVTNNWSAPGFKVRKSAFNSGVNSTTNLTTNDNAAYFNYNFGPITYANYGKDAAGALSSISPVLMNNEDDDWGLYLLISNSADKTLDVVIPLDMTMSKIAQSNSTSVPYTVGVLNGNISPADNNQTNIYFDKWDTARSSNNDQYAEIAQANLRGNSATALDTKVAAIQITGTAGTNPARVTPIDSAADPIGQTNSMKYGFATPAGDNAALNAGANTTHNPNAINLDSTYYYQLTENTLFKTATIVMINPNNQDLTMSDGTVLKQSIYAEAVDANFTTNMEGVHYTTINGAYTKQLEEGRTYTFTLDEQGHYIYWTTPRDTGKFVYGTYIDFTSKLASSTFDYPLVYVSANGEAKQQQNITKMTVNDGTTIGQMGMGYPAYTYTELPKRDNSSASAATSGYEKGYYIGYALNGSELTAIGPYNPNVPATFDNDLNTGFYQGAANDFGAATWTDALGTPQNGIMIDAAAENLGVAKVPSAATNIEYFLSNNTVFYVVDGAGTDNQTVKEYKGLAGLREGYSNVVIDVTANASSKLWTAGKYLKAANNTDGDVAGGSINKDNNDAWKDATKVNTNPYSMVYYSFGRTDYSQDYLGSAYEIKTVFLPIDALKYTATVENTLHFVGDKTQTNISVINGDEITQFEMYDTEGNKKLVWVDGYIGDTGASSAWVIDQNGDNVFYELVATGKATVDGQTIYSVRKLGADNIASIIGRYYDGTYTAAAAGVPASWTASVANTVSLTPTDEAVYAPTTTNAQVAYIDVDTKVNPNPNTADLYNVGSAKVVNLNTVQYPGVSSVPTLNNAGALTDNYGIEVSCVLTAKNSVTVSVIFVNAN